MFKFMWRVLKTTVTLIIGAAAGAAGFVAAMLLVSEDSYVIIDNEIKKQRKDIQEALRRA